MPASDCCWRVSGLSGAGGTLPPRLFPNGETGMGVQSPCCRRRIRFPGLAQPRLLQTLRPADCKLPQRLAPSLYRLPFGRYLLQRRIQ
jgi:hypothetical protein